MKKAIVGSGHAHKTQVQAMVQRLLALAATPGPDAADALGIAITHAHAGFIAGRTGQATPWPGASTRSTGGAGLLTRMRVGGGLPFA